MCSTLRFLERQWSCCKGKWVTPWSLFKAAMSAGPKPCTTNTQHQTPNTKHHPKPKTSNPKHQTTNHKPQTTNHKPQTTNPEGFGVSNPQGWPRVSYQPHAKPQALEDVRMLGQCLDAVSKPTNIEHTRFCQPRLLHNWIPLVVVKHLRSSSC